MKHIFREKFLVSSAMVLVIGALPFQAHAQSSSFDDEIIVTATKKAETLSDVSAAVSAVSGDFLQDKQIVALEDLQVAIPGITIGNDFAFAKIYVRGIGLNSALPGIDPSVALHVDGAVVSQASQQFASLYDLERVEVIRGPQGTLYGRNATGGSVNLITAKPTDELEGHLSVTFGSDTNLITEGAISGPITDNIQGRVAFRTQDREGFGTQTSSGEDIDNANKLGIRAQLNFDLSDRVSNLIAVDYYEEDERSKSFKFVAPTFDPTTIAGLTPAAIAAEFPDAGDQAAVTAQIPNLVSLAGPDALPNSRDAGGNQIPVGDLETFNVTNTFDFALNDNLAFKLITNFRDGTSLLLQDFDVSNLENGIDTTDPSTVQLQLVENNQFSQEVQFLYDSDRLEGIVGGYYFTDDVQSNVTIGTNPLAANALLPNVDDLVAVPNSELGQLLPDGRVAIVGDLDVEAFAIFANFTYSLTDQFRLRLGARYSDESRDIDVATRLPGPGITLGPGTDSRSFSDFTPEVGLEYDLGDTLLYASYSEGFKSGSAALVDGSPDLIEPETIDNFEVGFKGNYLDNRLNLNVAGFLYEIENAQFDRTFLIAGGPRFSTSVENAASQDGLGVEIEGSFRPTDNFKLDFNGTWYDIEFDEFNTTDPTEVFGALEGLAGLPIRTVDLSGNTPRNTPDLTFGVRGTYSQELGNGGFIDYSAAYAYKSEQFFTEFNDDRFRAGGYGILDANVKYTFPDNNLSFNLWAKNLTDEFVQSGGFAVATSRTIVGTYLPPRQYGATLGYKF